MILVYLFQIVVRIIPTICIYLQELYTKQKWQCLYQKVQCMEGEWQASKLLAMTIKAILLHRKPWSEQN